MDEYKNIIAIDPGAKGGIAVRQGNKYFTSGKDMNNYQEARSYFKHLKSQDENWIAFV